MIVQAVPGALVARQPWACEYRAVGLRGWNVPGDVVPDFLDPAVLDDPFEAYAELHERCPVFEMPQTGLFLVTRYEDARMVLTDTATFSSRPSPGASRQEDVAALYRRVMTEGGWARTPTLQRTDPPVHTRYRQLLGRVFTPRRVAEMSEHIDAVVHSLIDEFADRGECEFVSEFAIPLPGIIIAEQLGLDRSEIMTFRRWADAMLAMAQRALTEDEAVATAEIELQAQHFLAHEFEARRAEPRDDLISALVHAHGDDEEPLTMGELQDLMHQLVTGGFETTTAALGTGLWLLLRNPEQLALLREDPGLMKNFIEETLRFDSPVAGLWRMTTCPVRVGDTEIPEGAAVMPRFAAANRDAAVFAEPGRFDITRPNASSHLAFGVGSHYCIGAALARREMHLSFTALLDRLDDIELAGRLPDPAHETSFFLRPLKELPITFRAK